MFWVLKVKTLNAENWPLWWSFFSFLSFFFKLSHSLSDFLGSALNSLKARQWINELMWNDASETVEMRSDLQSNDVGWPGGSKCLILKLRWRADWWLSLRMEVCVVWGSLMTSTFHHYLCNVHTEIVWVMEFCVCVGPIAAPEMLHFKWKVVLQCTKTWHAHGNFSQPTLKVQCLRFRSISQQDAIFIMCFHYCIITLK